MPRSTGGPRNQLYKQLDDRIEKYYDALRRQNQALADKLLISIRRSVLLHGVAENDIIQESKEDDELQEDTNMLAAIRLTIPKVRAVEQTLRGRLWEVLLGIGSLQATEYQSLIARKESSYYVHIRSDTMRTFLTSVTYNSRVSEERLVRLLNSFCHKYSRPYLQGMNVIAAPLLYVMPELDAFASFCTMINRVIPMYYHTNGSNNDALVGAWAGCNLVTQTLELVDAELAQYLSRFHSYTYAFPLISSIFAICPPFEELIRLWDFLFCFGVHVNIVCIVAYFINFRDVILSTPQGRLLQNVLGQRVLPPIDSVKIISTTMKILPTVMESRDLWERIRTHLTDFEVAAAIKNRSTQSSVTMTNLNNDVILEGDEQSDSGNSEDNNKEEV